MITLKVKTKSGFQPLFRKYIFRKTTGLVHPAFLALMFDCCLLSDLLKVSFLYRYIYLILLQCFLLLTMEFGECLFT